MRNPYIGGNWKMNTDGASAIALAAAIAEGLPSGAPDVAICPPFVYLTGVREVLAARQSPIKLGAQNCSFEPKGAFTGEISLSMLRDCGVQVVLTGHSERRHIMGETDEVINKKTLAVLAAGLECILCIGETLSQHEAHQTDAVNQRQIRTGLAGVDAAHLTSGRLTIAYEPVWAIGTGKTATPADAQSAHANIRSVLGAMYSPEAAGAVRIQYGGSCNAQNAAELMRQPDIDGGLIGGASLKADDFLAIIRAAISHPPA